MICPQCNEDLCKVEFLYFDYDEKFDYERPKEICYDCAQSKLEDTMLNIENIPDPVPIINLLKNYAKERDLDIPDLLSEISATLSTLIIYSDMDEEDFIKFSITFHESLVRGRFQLNSRLNKSVS